MAKTSSRRSRSPGFVRLAAAALMMASAGPPKSAGAFVAFVVPSNCRRGTRPSSRSSSEGENFYDDFDDNVDVDPSSSSSSSSSSSYSSTASSRPRGGGDDGGDDDDDDLLASLRRRRGLLRDSSRELLGRWTSGNAESRMGFTVNESFYAGGGGGGGGGQTTSFDWVRRVGIGSYPRVACGSASGGIFVADVEVGKLLGAAPRAHWPSSSSASASSSDGGGNDDDHDYDLLANDDDLLGRLYGEYDGGGVLAVAMARGGGTDNCLVASAGREGGIKLHRWVRGRRSSSVGGIDELEFVGLVPMTGGKNDDDDNDDDEGRVVVTCLKFDSLGRRLYAGGGDGRLRVVTLDRDDIAGSMRTTLIPSRASTSINLRRSKRRRSSSSSSSKLSPILSLDVSEALDMMATAHANGDVRVYSLDMDDGCDACDGDDDDEIDALPLLGVWNPFADTNDACHARSVAFVSGGGGLEGDDDDDDENPSWSIVAGGGNGQLWVQEIHPSYYVHGTMAALSSSAAMTKNLDDENGRSAASTTATASMPSLFRENSMQQIKPSHRGPVLSMASRPGGILVSAGHDGMLRVSRICKPVPRALYGLGGYKVWIGSICIDDDGKRLLSDGRDDVVVVHDFSKEDEG